jgi:DNA invertase Pin-like site-specific DNA recombinase
VLRLERKTAGVLMLVDSLKDKGVKRVVDNLEGLGFTSQTGKLVFTTLTFLAEMEREQMLMKLRCLVADSLALRAMLVRSSSMK